MMGSDTDYEANFSQEFSDKAVRRGFIRKVYGILSCQILVTAAIIAIFVFSDSVKNWVSENDWFYITCLVVSLVVLLTLVCAPSIARKTPANFILLGIFTVLEGLMLGSLAAYYTADEIFLAMVITAIIVLALTAFAFQTKIDFTMMGGILMCVLLTFILVGFCFLFVKSKTAYLIYAGIGVLIFSVYIVFDTQLMMGGRHRFALSPEEYIFAALSLYLDILNLFLYILQIIGLSNE